MKTTREIMHGYGFNYDPLNDLYYSQLALGDIVIISKYAEELIKSGEIEGFLFSVSKKLRVGK